MGQGICRQFSALLPIWVVNWLSNRKQEKVPSGAHSGVTGVSLLTDELSGSWN